jgi:hypothetical protein
MVKYYAKGNRDYREKFNIGIPNKVEIDSVEISQSKLEKYLEVGYSKSSDRTLTFVPKLTQAVSYIWNVSVDKALVKVAEIMIDKNAGSQLSEKLTSTEMKVLLSKIEMLNSHNQKDSLDLAIADIEAIASTYAAKGSLDQDQLDEIELTLQYALNNHPINNQGEADERALDEILNEMVETSTNTVTYANVTSSSLHNPF